MRASQIRRHLGSAATALPRTASRALTAQDGASEFLLNLEFSPRDYVAYLLSIDAEIEHCLMVQYLYAAYSLGGPQVPPVFRDTVRNWQEVILGIAKEEMGHLISVQNVLRLIGAPLHFEREDYPWDVPFYPFPFMLQPLTLDSLAKYVYTEAAVGWNGGALGDEIRARVATQTSNPHQVAELFDTLIPLVEDPLYLPDYVFQPDTFSCQANFAEWGRGYQGGNRGNSEGRSVGKTPDVLVVPVTCRDDAVNALKAIAKQGEAPHGSEPSHFVRFLRVYVEMRAAQNNQPCSLEQWNNARPDDFLADAWAHSYPDIGAALQASHGTWSASRPVAINPYVSLDTDEEPEQGGTPATAITDPESALWATLHNVRYRMLLTYLIHSFTLYGGLNAAGLITPRGTIVNATFGEMYNLRAISEVLMQSPVSATDPNAGFAGPPFQMPYTLNSPFGEADRWIGHLDLLTASEGLIAALLATSSPARHAYLHSLREADKSMIAIAKRILSGSIDPALL
ncbi:ferritin-like protein [Collimonas sp. PA-H2]|uniref:ferritin-like domain-containing protein n=1 Tax=Collimonas sp. PA-H2 TaxID=1881062 RepID=UPI000BF63EB2|nr:ferritin-like domain-containing protein [Collimonas sp. PA-H2]PFH10275.1 ferritin-like protein [Collimonas sp. PA-H2]